MTRPSSIKTAGARGNPASGSAAGTFDADVAAVVLRLRAALAAVLAGLARPVRGGTDIQRELGLPSTLSWQLHGFIGAADPLGAAALIPGRHAMRRALAAAEARGVAREVVGRAAAAFDEFEACVERHTGSRAAFNSMVSGLTEGETTAVDLKARREAHRAMSHIYGVQVGVMVQCFILHPGASGDRYDFVFISAAVGLRVMRPFEKLLIGRHLCEPEKPGREAPPGRPLGTGMGGVPVLEEFSSGPQLRFSSEPCGNGQSELYVSGPPVGRTGELTYVLAEHWPSAVPADEPLHCDATVMHPSELLIHDVVLAPGMAPAGYTPRMGVYGNALSEVRRRRREVDRLRVGARSQFAGVGVGSLETAEAPRYVEMLRSVCAKLGWDAEGLETYRCRIEYPVLHSLVTAEFPAPVEGGNRAPGVCGRSDGRRGGAWSSTTPG